MEWVKTHYKTILSTLLTIVLVCSMALFIVVPTSAKELYSVSRSWSHAQLKLSNSTIDYDVTINQNSSGVLEFNADYPYFIALQFISFPVDDGISIDPTYYGLTAERLVVDIYFDIQLPYTSSNIYDSLDVFYLDLYDSQGYVYGVNFPLDQVDFVTSVSNGAKKCHASLDISLLNYFPSDILDRTDLNDFTFMFKLGASPDLGYDYDNHNISVVITPLESHMTFYYSSITEGDIINDSVQDGFNDLNSNLDSNFDHLEDILTTPTTDIPVNNDQMSDAVGSIGSALDDYVSADQSIEQSIQSIYDTYNNNPQDYGNSLVGLVSNVKDIANSNLFSACWGFVKDYPVIYWLVNMAIVLCVVTFLLRR